jgi:phage tail protein X
LIVNDLTTDEEFNLGNLGAPISSTVPLSGGTIVGHQVDIAEEIPLAFEADSGHAPIGDIPLDHLAFHGLGEICVALVGTTEKANFGLADEVRILSTDRNELGDTTRHFIV